MAFIGMYGMGKSKRKGGYYVLLCTEGQGLEREVWVFVEKEREHERGFNCTCPTRNKVGLLFAGEQAAE